MKQRKEMAIRKIWLRDFIQVLIDVYDQGANFVDIVGFPEGPQDVLRIEVKPEYMDNGGNDEVVITEEMLSELI